jgi:hypothetical protein
MGYIWIGVWTKRETFEPLREISGTFKGEGKGVMKVDFGCFALLTNSE